MIDSVVVMRARPVVVVVIDVIRSGVHVQLDRLHVHQRESGNQRERDQPTESSDHLFLNIVLHSSGRQFAVVRALP